MGVSDFLVILGRGFRRRCPQCGQGGLFARWYTLAPNCSRCGLPFSEAEGDTWAFMYFSTAFLTGVIVIAMMLTRPAIDWAGRLCVAAVAMVMITGTLPIRKGLGIAIDYFITLKWHNHAGHALRRTTQAPAKTPPIRECDKPGV